MLDYRTTEAEYTMYCLLKVVKVVLLEILSLFDVDVNYHDNNSP